jgi:hypothetical protein
MVKDISKMTPEEQKTFKKHQQQFFENPNVDPVSGKTVRIGNFKPYEKLVNTYGKPPETKKVKSTRKPKEKKTIEMSSETSIETSGEEKPKKVSTKTNKVVTPIKPKEKTTSEEKPKKVVTPIKEKTSETSKKVATPIKEKTETSVGKPKSPKKQREEELPIAPPLENKTTIPKKELSIEVPMEQLMSGEQPQELTTYEMLLHTPFNKLKYLIEEGQQVNNQFWRQRFDLDELPLISIKSQTQDWLDEYEKLTNAKKEALKLVKVALVTTKTPTFFTLQFNIKPHLIDYLPPNMPKKALHEGEVHIRCLLNEDTWLGHYTAPDYNQWRIAFIEENEDEETVEEIQQSFKAILLFLTVIQYFIMYKKELIQIKSEDGVMLSRQDLNPKDKNMFPSVVAYRMADYDAFYTQ